MATLTITPIKTFISGETVTPAKLNELGQSTVALTAGTIVDADISASAAIAASKLAGTLDLSSKTVTLPDASVAQAKLAANVVGNGPAFRAYANSTTTIGGSGSATKITLGGEDYDTANCFASSRFTPNVAGYYQINAAALLASGSGTPGAPFFAVLVYKNGSFALGGSHSNAADSRSSTVSDLIYLNGTTDYLELYANQFSGGDRTVISSRQWTFLSGFLARAA
jgi:hypothetical protein